MEDSCRIALGWCSTFGETMASVRRNLLLNCIYLHFLSFSITCWLREPHQVEFCGITIWFTFMSFLFIPAWVRDPPGVEFFFINILFTFFSFSISSWVREPPNAGFLLIVSLLYLCCIHNARLSTINTSKQHNVSSASSASYKYRRTYGSVPLWESISIRLVCSPSGKVPKSTDF